MELKTPDATLALGSLTTLSFEQLALQYPAVSFIHSHPGGVKTDIIEKLLDTAPGIWSYPAWFVKRFIAPIFWFLSKPFAVPLEEVGERHLFLATSSAYPARKVGEQVGIQGGVVPLVDGLEVKKATLIGEDGRGNGVYRSKSDNETLPERKALVDLRREGLDVAGWRETVKVFDRVLGEGAIAGGL